MRLMPRHPARAVLSGKATTSPKGHNDHVEAIRMLKVVYASAMKDRTAAIYQFHTVVSTSAESLRDELDALPATPSVRWCASGGIGKATIS